MILSWGWSRPVQTAKLAGDPDRDCTLTPHQFGLKLKAYNALFWQIVSIQSTQTVPPQYLAPGQPSEYLLLSTLPTAAKQALEQQFSEAIRLIPLTCRSFSLMIFLYISGSDSPRFLFKKAMDRMGLAISLAIIQILNNKQQPQLINPIIKQSHNLFDILHFFKMSKLINELEKHYNRKMENQENADKLTEARSSRQMETSVFRRIFQNACSCFIPCLFRNQREDDMLESKIPYQKGQLQTNELRDSKNQKSLMSEQTSRFATSWDDRKQFLIRSVYQHANRLLQDYDESLDKSTIKKWHSYSIYQYRQNELISLGTTNGRVLCKISCARVQPSSVSKKKTNQSRSYQRSADHFTNSNFDKYWNRRYFLFQRFDQGISLDDESWYSVTPEAVAEYIAGKIRCDTVLDGFCGAGGNALKLANTCSRVICNDICSVKLKCLETNAKVYCVENIEMLNENFLQLEGVEPDVVFLSPPPGSEQSLSLNSIQPRDMKPPLDKIFAKAITMSKNIVMLLPPNISMHKLGQLIAKSYMESGIPSSTCSVKIQKVFFNSHLKYIAVYLGSIIENEMSLNDELCYIYKYLKEGGKKIFTHKKVIRYLREKYGMMFLLNLVFDLNKLPKSGTLIQKFYIVIREKNLISQQKLEKLIQQQNTESQIYNRKKIPLILDKQIMEQEKYVAQDTDKQVTLSYYSQSSGNKGVRDSKIEDVSSRHRSFRSSAGKDQMSFQQIQRANTIQFCPNRESFEQNTSNPTNADSNQNSR